ncbi:MAG: exosortase H [Planctomycetota bacterium]
MRKSRGRHRSGGATPREASAGAAARPRVDRRLAGAFGLFALCLVVYYSVTALAWFQQDVFPAYLRWNAAVSARLLAWAGEGATANDTVVLSQRYALEIKRGCDAIEPAALLAAAIIAFPAAWRRRAIGLAIGIPALLGLNFVRIISLYYTGIHAPDAFEVVHVEVWQPLFIAAALLLWVGWAIWATRRRAAAAA